jgi:hypothetical protein
LELSLPEQWMEYWSTGVLEYWKIPNPEHQIANKFQISSNKYDSAELVAGQINSKFQAPNANGMSLFNVQCRKQFWNLVLGHCDLFGFCAL